MLIELDSDDALMFSGRKTQQKWKNLENFWSGFVYQAWFADASLWSPN